MKKPSRSIFLLFLLLSLFLYFYKYPKMLTFDADQEFYANEYLKAVSTHKLTLLGIETSVGGMFVGPLYTYLSIVIYWLFRGNPLGIFLLTLLFASFQPGLTYYFFTKLRGKKVGLLSGLLVLISAGLWNKAFAPSAINFLYPMGLFFFYILVGLGENLTRRQTGGKYFLWLGVILALALQIHFSLFFFFPITIVFLVWYKLITKKNARNLFYASLPILASLSPLIIFDFRHRFFITNNLWRFITHNSILQGSSLGVFTGLAELFSHILVPKPAFPVYAFLAGVLTYFATRVRKEFTYKVTGLIYAVSIAIFIFYRGPKPDYFFYFLLPPFFLVTADLISIFISHKILKYPAYLFIIFLAFQNLQFMFGAINHYNFRLKDAVAKYIRNQSRGEKVKISYDTELGLGFGFDYLLRYEGVNMDNSNFEENYHIVIKNYQNYPGKEFREEGSPVSIKVVKIKPTSGETN